MGYNFVAFSQYLNFKPHIREAYGVTYYGPCALLRSDIDITFPRDWETPQKSSIQLSFEEKIEEETNWSVRTYLNGWTNEEKKGMLGISLEDQQGSVHS